MSSTDPCFWFPTFECAGRIAVERATLLLVRYGVNLHDLIYPWHYSFLTTLVTLLGKKTFSCYLRIPHQFSFLN
jgi:hypothetical protein